MKKFFTTLAITLASIVSLNAQNTVKVESVYVTSALSIGVADIDNLPKLDLTINRFEVADTYLNFQLTTPDGAQYVMYLQLEKNDYMPTHRCVYHYSVTSGSLITASPASYPAINVFEFRSGQALIADGMITVRGTVLIEDPNGNGYNTTTLEFTFE